MVLGLKMKTAEWQALWKKLSWRERLAVIIMVFTSNPNFPDENTPSGP